MQEPAHVEPFVARRVRRQPPAGLLELPLASDLVLPLLLQPGDDGVDEPLVEVAFAGLGPAPDRLERLVRLEVLAACRELETALVVRPGHPLELSKALLARTKRW